LRRADSIRAGHKAKAETKHQPRGGTEMKLLAAKEWNKVFHENGFKYRIKVRADLIHRDGNKKPYFSITGEVDRRAKNNRWVCELAGAIHDEIAKRMPELAPLLLVHLADDNGVPMHAYENAGYWAGQTKYQQLDLETLADHLRVTRQEAFEMIEYIYHSWGELDSITTPAMAWKDACEHYDLPAKWQQDADAARKMLNQLAQLEEAK
jgi:hypothetical protein